MFAVHNIHSPAVEIDEAGSYSVNGRDRIKCGVPIFAADDRDEAEAWRMRQLLDWKAA